MKRMFVAVLGLFVFLGASLSLTAKTPHKAGDANWKAENKRWVAFHMIGVKPDNLDATKDLIVEGLAPLGFNVLVLEVDYGFQFKSHPELQTGGLDKEQARMLAKVCREHGIRLIPLMNCLGHQSWGAPAGRVAQEIPPVRRDALDSTRRQEDLLPRVVPVEPGREQDRIRAD